MDITVGTEVHDTHTLRRYGEDGTALGVVTEVYDDGTVEVEWQTDYLREIVQLDDLQAAK